MFDDDKTIQFNHYQLIVAIFSRFYIKQGFWPALTPYLAFTSPYILSFSIPFHLS